jgi:general secretion pathway protein G
LLIITMTILSILAGMALAVARFTVRRQKEKELHSDLERMRRAIDKYKEACDRGGFLVRGDTYGYPDSLERLVEGVDVAGTKVKFLREIPVDTMTGTRDWGCAPCRMRTTAHPGME